MARYMLDTDTCSYIMKRSSEAILKRLRAVPVSDVCISVITKSELLYGVEVSPRRTQDATALQAFLPHVAVLDFPDDAAAHYAQIRADLKKRGQVIGANDLFIAAHARSLGLRLVTNNIDEFRRVKGLTLEELDDASDSSFSRDRRFCRVTPPASTAIAAPDGRACTQTGRAARSHPSHHRAAFRWTRRGRERSRRRAE
jgi:tRNA(fMet)-specific endonuclease VapC